MFDIFRNTMNWVLFIDAAKLSGIVWHRQQTQLLHSHLSLDRSFSRSFRIQSEITGLVMKRGNTAY